MEARGGTGARKQVSMDNQYFIGDQNQHHRYVPAALPQNARVYLLEIQKGKPGQHAGYIHNL